MAEAANQEYSTIIGPDAQFKGTVTFEKGLRVHGRLEGQVSTNGIVHIARDGKLQAEVQAGAIVIEGEGRGPLNASDRIELKQTAHYEGDLRTAKLTVESGAVFSGHVTVDPDAATKPASAPKAQVMRPALNAARQQQQQPQQQPMEAQMARS